MSWFKRKRTEYPFFRIVGPSFNAVVFVHSIAYVTKDGDGIIYHMLNGDTIHVTETTLDDTERVVEAA